MTVYLYLSNKTIPQRDILTKSIKVQYSEFNSKYVSGLTRVGFLWNNDYKRMPFGTRDCIINGKVSKFFTYEFITFVSQYPKLVVDLLTCDLDEDEDQVFYQEILSLKQLYPNLQINYSTNLTGNGANNSDWIMESSGENIKDYYFNDYINYYTSYLALFATSLNAEQGISNQLKITWIPPENYYADISFSYNKVVWQDSVTNDISQYLIYNNTIQQYTINNLVNNRLYDITIYTYYGDSEKTALATLRVAPKNFIPSNLVATVNTNNADINLSWLPVDPTDFNGYNFTKYILTFNSSTRDIVDRTIGNSIFSGLLYNTIYTFTVTAVYQVKTYDSYSITAVPSKVPSVPKNLSSYANINKIDLSWGSPDDLGGNGTVYYLVQYSIDQNNWTTSSSEDKLTTSITNLTNGIAYYVRVFATNNNGNSLTSANLGPIIPYNVPNPVSSVIAIDSDSKATINWVINSDNGNAITAFKVEYYETQFPGTTWSQQYDGSNITQAEITGLVNGTEYAFKVYAQNNRGYSTASTSNSIIPAKIPDAPNNLAVTVIGDHAITLSWNAPNNNGAPINGFGYNVYSSKDVFIGHLNTDNLTYNYSGLSNGTQYSFKVTAINRKGESNFSNIVSATPFGLPFPISYLNANDLDSAVNLNWTIGNNNGSDISQFTVISNYTKDSTTYHDLYIYPGSNVSNVTINDLSNGQPYSFTVYATNERGDSSQITSNVVTPAKRPNAPINVTITDISVSAVSLSWTKPENGGSTILGYRVYVSSDSFSQYIYINNDQYSVYGENLLTYTVTDLNNGTSYSFKVSAVNRKGESLQSNASSSIIPYTIPDAPINALAVDSNSKATVSWNAPVFNGGNNITSYKIVSVPDNIIKTVDYNIFTTDISGLTNGVNYYFMIYAINNRGISLGTSTNIVTPATVPNAPYFSEMSNIQPTSITLSWNPINNLNPASPYFNGGSNVLFYTIYKSNDSLNYTIVDTTTDTSYNVINLTSGIQYSFKLSASNRKGESELSSVTSEKPYSVPNQVTNLYGIPHDTTISLFWTPPLFDGGRAITSYTVKYNNNGNDSYITLPGSNISTTIVSGLSNKVSYSFQVYSTNIRGDSEYVSVGNLIPYGIPSIPLYPNASSGNQYIDLFWSTPIDENGRLITTYKYIYATSTDKSSWSEYSEKIDMNTVYNTYRLSNRIQNGLWYKFIIYATNLAGDSNPSIETSPVKPSTKPDVPFNLSIVENNSENIVSWTAPASNGDAIRYYNIYISTLNQYDNFILDTSVNAPNTQYTDSNLTNGNSYWYKITAINIDGESDYSQVIKGIPYTVPNAPQIIQVQPFDSSLNIEWIIPSSQGRDISYYTIYANNLTPIIINNPLQTKYILTGLQNGTVYNISMTATNIKGESLSSNIISSIETEPFTVSTKPLLVTASPFDTSANITWYDPIFDGGRDISYYIIIAYNVTTDKEESANYSDIDGSFNNVVFTGLTNGDSYQFYVSAVNEAGSSPKSDYSNIIIPYGRPYAPFVLVTGGDQIADLQWSLPDLNGRPLDYYSYDFSTSSDNSSWNNWSSIIDLSMDRTLHLTELNNGIWYRFRIYTHTAYGYSLASVSSNSVKPAKVPNPVSDVSAFALLMSNKAFVSWTKPVDNGGDTIIGYRIRIGGNLLVGGEVLGENTTSTTIDVLNDIINDVEVVAYNLAGESIPVSSGKFMVIDISNITNDHMKLYNCDQLALITSEQYVAMRSILSTINEVTSDSFIKSQLRTYVNNNSNNIVRIPKDQNSPYEFNSEIKISNTSNNDLSGNTCSIDISTLGFNNVFVLLDMLNVQLLANNNIAHGFVNTLVYFKVLSSATGKCNDINLGQSVLSAENRILMTLVLPNVNDERVILYRYEFGTFNTNTTVTAYRVSDNTYEAYFTVNSCWAVVSGVTAQSGGDPYVRPVFGTQYLIPNDINYVNLLCDQENKVLINAKTSLLEKSDFSPVVYAKDAYCVADKISYLYNFTYYREFYIQFGNQSVTINADTLEFIENSSLTNIKLEKFIPKNGMYSLVHNKSYPIFNTTKGLRISFNNYTIILLSDVMTDERHHIKISSTANLNNCFGAIISKDKLLKFNDIKGSKPEFYNWSNMFIESN